MYARICVCACVCMCVCVCVQRCASVCVPSHCLPASHEPRRPDTDERLLTPLLPSPPCGLPNNGNLIGGREEQGCGGEGWDGGGVRLLWETLQSAGPPICPLELFVTVSSTVISPLLFLGRAIIAPIPLTYPQALCAETGSGFNFFHSVHNPLHTHTHTHTHTLCAQSNGSHRQRTLC